MMTKNKFILKGYNTIIQFEINKIFTDSKAWDNGTGFQGTLFIECNGLILKNNYFHSTSVALKKFYNELQKIYSDLKGEANYCSDYEDNLNITIKMKECGHSLIVVEYRDYSLEDMKVSFCANTDQSYLLETICCLKEMEEYFNSLDS